MKNLFYRWLYGLLNLLQDDPAADINPSAVEPADRTDEQIGAISAEEASLQDTQPVPVDGAAPLPQEVQSAGCPKSAGCPDCRSVILSDRAYSALVSETLYRHPDETGGIFLGQRHDGIWYVVEATDPGMETLHTTVHHEMDDKYLNHTYRARSRMYRCGLDLLGLWHRHPGSFDRFSANDMETNAAYARVNGDGAISLLVNIDPDIRLTCHYCKLQPNGSVRTFRVPVLVGDRHFAGTDFLSLIYPNARIIPVTERPAVHAEIA